MPLVSALVNVLTAYTPLAFSVPRAVYLLGTLPAILGLLALHHRQWPDQPRAPRSAWRNAAAKVIEEALKPQELHTDEWDEYGPDDEEAKRYSQLLMHDIEDIIDYLGIDIANPYNPLLEPTSQPPRLLLTRHTHCVRCAVDGQVHNLQKRRALKHVPIIDEYGRKALGIRVIATCNACKAEYWPDCIKIKGENGRLQIPDCDAAFVHVSKSASLYVHRRIGKKQERALLRMRAGWSNFTDFFNDTEEAHLTTRQGRRLFYEHFSRRLIVAHGCQDTFRVDTNLSYNDLVKQALNFFGNNWGLVPGGKEHECRECTHKKRYRADLEEGGPLPDAPINAVADVHEYGFEPPVVPNAQPNPVGGAQSAPPFRPQNQERPPADAPQRYVKAAVIDGKTLKHKICVVPGCYGDLLNYRNGRFCLAHDDLKKLCGLVQCDNPVNWKKGDVVCNVPSHRTFYEGWRRRHGGRHVFNGTNRAMRDLKDHVAGTSDGAAPRRPTLPPGPNGEDGATVKHYFRAATIYCVLTFQWACGVPIGWTKCYKSEGPRQVIRHFKKVFPPEKPEDIPDIVFYDRACGILSHLVTQNINDVLVKSVRWLVDAWHYIGHSANDVFCRTWSNPAPRNGSQPDLVLVHRDAAGRLYMSRAFNSETAEQLNAWLSSFEKLLMQMTAWNFDFMMHSLLLLYKEDQEKRIKKKGLDELD